MHVLRAFAILVLATLFARMAAADALERMKMERLRATHERTCAGQGARAGRAVERL